MSTGPRGPRSQGNTSESQSLCTEYNCICGVPGKKVK